MIEISMPVNQGSLLSSVASHSALSLSSLSLIYQSSRLIRPQAARTPTYLIYPPSIFLITLACSISFEEPMTKLPTGHPIPLLKQKLTVSKSLTMTAGSIFKATAALSPLAASKCILNLCLLAIALTYEMYSVLSTLPLQRFCEDSSSITLG